MYFKWFSSKDYSKVCGVVDFGLSFHNSPSELDIPIKILDCFSCKVPVLAYNYSNSLEEIIKDSENGYKFDSSIELYFLIDKFIKKKLKLKYEFDQKTWE